MNGFGRGNGFGFHGSSPPWPYVGRGRGGLPRGAYSASFSGAFPTYPGYPTAAAPVYNPAAYPYYAGEPPTAWGTPNVPEATPEQETEYLKGQTKALKSDLEHIQSRIEELEKKK